MRSARVLRSYWDSIHLSKAAAKNAETPAPVQRLLPPDLARLTSPPSSARISTRDFIHDSLYNPHYGYFSKQAPLKPIDFTSLRDGYAFMNYLSKLYYEFESQASLDERIRQVWHTPTELFRPIYGNAIANYITKEFIKDSKGSKEIVIYEVGGGNGTLMLNILDFIKEHNPTLYLKTKYKIVEISPALAALQTNKKLNHRNFEIINKSIFDWNQTIQEPCFVIATEVIDNFSHDVVRFNYESEEPYQGVVLVDEFRNYEEAYEPISDPLLLRFLDLRKTLGIPSAALSSKLRRKARSMLPFAPNLTRAEFVPTKCMEFVEILEKFFPKHRLVLSDFDSLPDAMAGVNGPVVQTRYRNQMVPCSTYLVEPGWFDIFFPTDFTHLKAIYDELVVKKQSRETKAQVLTQREFLERYADIKPATTKSGEIPLLTFYSNFRFLLT